MQNKVRIIFKKIKKKTKNVGSRIQKRILKTKENLRLHLLRIKANRCYKKNDLKNAILIWKEVYDKFEFSVQEYERYLRALINERELNIAIAIANDASTKHNSSKLFLLGLQISVEQGNSKNILKYFTKIDGDNVYNVIKDIDTWLTIIRIYIKSNALDKAKDILNNVEHLYPKHKKEIAELNLKLLIKTKQWKNAIELLLRLSANFENEFKLIMLYQIVGNTEEVNKRHKIFQDKYQSEIEQDEWGYRKLIIFDNGDSRIEFCKKLFKNEMVFLTFDSINMVWDNPSFGFKLLKKENTDIIAVRKRKKQEYQQDLTQETFLTIVKPMVENYKEKLAYGFSLGAYLSLYFASLLDFKILSLSPRLSIHPIYGRKHIIEKYEMKHNLELPENKNISPIIVYDPKNVLDNNYINNEVRKRYPNANIVEIPYGGHGTATYLRDTGQLKSFVHDFINNQIPVFDRNLRMADIEYYANLANECVKHKKYQWALNVIEEGLKLNAKSLKARQLKIRILMRLKEFEKALEYTEESIAMYKKDLGLRLSIVDIYIETAKLEKAKCSLSKLQSKYKNNKAIESRLKKISLTSHR